MTSQTKNAEFLRMSPTFQTRLAFIELRRYVKNYYAIRDSQKKGEPIIKTIKRYCEQRNAGSIAPRYNVDAINFDLIAQCWADPSTFPMPDDRY